MKITTAQIEALRQEAASAGDDAQVKICEQALRGSRRAHGACARVIKDAAGMSAEPKLVRPRKEQRRGQRMAAGRLSHREITRIAYSHYSKGQ